MKEGYQYPEMSKPEFSVRIPGPFDVAAAQTVSEWTKNAPTMLPKTPEEILDLFTQGHSVLVVGKAGEIMCHAAATFTYDDGLIEVGGIYTAPEHRGKGLATHATYAVIARMRERYPEQKLFALANFMSKPMFLKMGGREMSSSELSSQVWEPCETCPRKPESNEQVVFQCCDVPVDLTDVRIATQWQYSMV